MFTLTLLLLTASLAYTVSRALRLPPVPILLAAGLGLNVSGLTENLLDQEFLENTLMLGLAFLVFHAGTELNPRRIGTRVGRVLGVAGLQFFAVGGLGLSVALALGKTLTAALLVALAIAASSTLVVVRLLQERRHFYEPQGQLVVGVLLVQDLLVILAIGIIAGVTQPSLPLVVPLGAIAGFVLVTWLLVRFATPWVLGRLSLDEETLLLALLTILFLFAGAAALADLPLAVGAFFAGIAVSGFPVNALIRGQLNSLTDFFLAIFFVALGAFIVLPSTEGWMLAGVLALLVLVVTPPLVAWLIERMGWSARAALESGLLLAQTSELSIVVGMLGVSRGLLEPEVFSALALTTLLTMLLTPLLVRAAVIDTLVHWHPSQRRHRAHSALGHVVVLGCGRQGFDLVHRLRERGHRVLVVDDDPAVVASLLEEEIEAVRGDAATPRLLEAIQARRAGLIVSFMRRTEDNLKLLRSIRNVPVYVRVFESHDARAIRRAGGHPIAYADATAKTFIAWFEQTFPRPPGGEEGAT